MTLIRGMRFNVSRLFPQNRVIVACVVLWLLPMPALASEGTRVIEDPESEVSLYGTVVPLLAQFVKSNPPSSELRQRGLELHRRYENMEPTLPGTDSLGFTTGELWKPKSKMRFLALRIYVVGTVPESVPRRFTRILTGPEIDMADRTPLSILAKYVAFAKKAVESLSRGERVRCRFHALIKNPRSGSFYFPQSQEMVDRLDEGNPETLPMVGRLDR